MKKIIVGGLGSMGKRRIRLLKSIGDYSIVGVDLSNDARSQVKREFKINTFKTFKDAFLHDEYDIGFVCTSPESHFEVVKLFLTQNLHVFSELNLVNESHDTLIELSAKVNKILFLSSTFLYRKEIDYINTYINKSSSSYVYNYHVGQFLLDWHPWQNPKDYFIFNKKTNALREIMAIELPWIIEVFGEFNIRNVKSKKISSLDIDFDDTIQICLEHKNGHLGYLIFDVISPKPIRNINVYNQMGSIKWGGTVDSLETYDKKTKRTKHINLYDNAQQLESYADFVVEDAYMEEIIQFFNTIDSNSKPKYSFEKDIKIMNILDEIEDQANEI